MALIHCLCFCRDYKVAAGVVGVAAATVRIFVVDVDNCLNKHC